MHKFLQDAALIIIINSVILKASSALQSDNNKYDG